MIAQFEQDIYNKNYTLQDQGKDDPIDTLENRIKFWINNIITKDLIILFVVESAENFLREEN